METHDEESMLESEITCATSLANSSHTAEVKLHLNTALVFLMFISIISFI